MTNSSAIVNEQSERNVEDLELGHFGESYPEPQCANSGPVRAQLSCKSSVAMSLLRSSIHRQLGSHTPCPFPLTPYQSLHSSAPTCKKFKPQKPFLMPGQTPGQQRAERKHLEAVQKAAKRFAGKDAPGVKPTRVGFAERSSSPNRDPQRFGMKEGMGQSPVASGSSSRLSWDARDNGESDRPRSPQRFHLNHNRMDSSKPFVPRHLRPANRREPLDPDDEHDSISSAYFRPKRIDLDWTDDPVDVPLVATRKRSLDDHKSLRSSSASPDALQYSNGSRRTNDAMFTGRSDPRSRGRSPPMEPWARGRGYATSSVSLAQYDGFVVRSSSSAMANTASTGTKSKEPFPTTPTSENDWRTPSQSDYARYDRMRARAKMGRGGTSFPAKEGERRSGQPDRVFTPRTVTDKDMIRRDETQRVERREDDYSRPFKPTRSTDTGRYHRDVKTRSSSMSSPFQRSNMGAGTTEPPSSSFATTTEDRPESRWAPTKRLSRPAMQGIQDLHRQDPVKYSRAALSKGFGVSVEAITRILKSDGRWIKREVTAEGK